VTQTRSTQIQNLAQIQDRSLGPIVLCIREKIIEVEICNPCPQHPFYSQEEAGQKEEERQLMVFLGRETPAHLTSPFSSPKSLPFEPPCPLHRQVRESARQHGAERPKVGGT
jgi:ribosomal protein L31